MDNDTINRCRRIVKDAQEVMRHNDCGEVSGKRGAIARDALNDLCRALGIEPRDPMHDVPSRVLDMARR